MISYYGPATNWFGPYSFTLICHSVIWSFCYSIFLLLSHSVIPSIYHSVIPQLTVIQTFFWIPSHIELIFSTWVYYDKLQIQLCLVPLRCFFAEITGFGLRKFQDNSSYTDYFFLMPSHIDLIVSTCVYYDELHIVFLFGSPLIFAEITGFRLWKFSENNSYKSFTDFHSQISTPKNGIKLLCKQGHLCHSYTYSFSNIYSNRNIISWLLYERIS